MKMVTAIVNKKDSGRVCSLLTEKGFFFTKIATQGGFLRAGNVTLLLGTEDEKVDEIIALLKENCAKRTEPYPYVTHVGHTVQTHTTEVVVGGATVFVTDVSRYEKM